MSDPQSDMIQRELERRLRLLDDTNEEEFGRFSGLDWALVVVLCVIVPLLVVWWGA